MTKHLQSVGRAIRGNAPKSVIMDYTPNAITLADLCSGKMCGFVLEKNDKIYAWLEYRDTNTTKVNMESKTVQALYYWFDYHDIEYEHNPKANFFILKSRSDAMRFKLRWANAI